MRTGANLNEVNRIKEMYAEGMNSKEISKELNIYESCVASFAPVEEDEDDDDEPLGD